MIARRTYLALILVAASTALGAAARGVADDVAAVRRPAPEQATAVAEHLRYSATWNGLPVASAELNILPSSARQVQLRGQAKTSEVLDLLWQMRDSFEATVDAAPVRPRSFVLRQHENDHRRETWVARDPAGARLVGTKHRRGRKHSPQITAVTLTGRLHDPASVAYLIRSLPPELERAQTYEVFTGSKTYLLRVGPGGTDEIEVAGRRWPARKLRLALQLVPKGERAGASARDPGADGLDVPRATMPEVPLPEPSEKRPIQEADLWVSTGPERLPLRMRARTFWGWVTVELVERAGPTERAVLPPADSLARVSHAGDDDHAL